MADENKTKEQQEEKVKRVREKIAQIEKEEKIKIKTGIHFRQYNPKYYPIDLQLAIAVINKHEGKNTIEIEFLPE